MEVPNVLAGRNFSSPYDHSPYASVKLHKDMICDRSLLQCRNALVRNKHLFQDKVVLEVNCGTGILSMLIASHGAKTVIGVEPSAMATIARANVEKNNLKNVHIISQDVDKIENLPLDIEKVDIVVSQWQAYLMFDRKLLESLLLARDRWLKPRGFMFPDMITLHIVGAQCESFQPDFHRRHRLRNFNFTSLSEVLYRFPRIENVPSEQIVTDSATVRKMDLKKMSVDDFSFSENFTLTCTQDSYIHAFLLYFEVAFGKGHKTHVISSSPSHEQTRWKQIVFCFENELGVTLKEQIKGTFKMKVDDNDSALNFHLAVDFSGKYCRTQFSKEYILQ